MKYTDTIFFSFSLPLAGTDIAEAFAQVHNYTLPKSKRICAKGAGSWPKVNTEAVRVFRTKILPANLAVLRSANLRAPANLIAKAPAPNPLTLPRRQCGAAGVYRSARQVAGMRRPGFRSFQPAAALGCLRSAGMESARPDRPVRVGPVQTCRRGLGVPWGKSDAPRAVLSALEGAVGVSNTLFKRLLLTPPFKGGFSSTQ